MCAVLAANLKGAAGALTRLRNQGRGMEGLGGGGGVRVKGSPGGVVRVTILTASRIRQIAAGAFEDAEKLSAPLFSS